MNIEIVSVTIFLAVAFGWVLATYLNNLGWASLCRMQRKTLLAQQKTEQHQVLAIETLKNAGKQETEITNGWKELNSAWAEVDAMQEETKKNLRDSIQILEEAKSRQARESS